MPELINSEVQRIASMHRIATKLGLDVSSLQKAAGTEFGGDWYQQMHIAGMEERSGEETQLPEGVSEAMKNFSVLVVQAMYQNGYNPLNFI